MLRRNPLRKWVGWMLLVLALGTSGPSGCAGLYELKSLGDDRLDDGFNQVLLWRVRLVDHTSTLGGIPRFWLAIHKPGKELVAEIPGPDNRTSRTFEDGTSLYEATYTTESRAYPMEIETGTYTARGSNRTPMPLMGTRLWLLFAPPIAVASVPGQLTHLGILRIEITDLKGKDEVIFTQALAHDRVVEQADVEAFRSRYPAVASRLRSN